ncbi:hypothetical protein ACFLIM_48645 [Nonomuraea sp. M3C6]|uniref:Uncharacterized protein n=1 Tax=Nonomuraea marmarensis TaxID=3351344 RepID=A0ABW7AYH0_9ACTN
MSASSGDAPALGAADLALTAAETTRPITFEVNGLSPADARQMPPRRRGNVVSLTRNPQAPADSVG